MAEKFEIEVPIDAKGGAGGIASAGEGLAKSMEKSMTKSLKSVGAAKMAGTMAAVLGVLDSIQFIIKPILSLFKVILMLLFMPLIPILKPAMQALAAFIKWFAPVMKKVSSFIEKVHKAITDFITALILGIAGVIGFIFKGLGEAWEVIKGAGIWIWENIILPGFRFLGDLGLKIWEVIKGLFKGVIDVGTKVWEFIKTRFKGFITVGSLVWGFVKSLFKGTINVATTVWNWFRGLFKGFKKMLGFQAGGVVPGPIGAPQLAVVHGGERITPPGGGIIVNINHPSVRRDSDIKMIANEVSRVLQRQMPGRIAQ